MTEEVVVSVEPEFLDKKATCRVLGDISVDQLERFMRAGLIVPKVVGSRTIVFPLAEVRRFARECPSWEPKRAAS